MYQLGDNIDGTRDAVWHLLSPRADKPCLSLLLITSQAVAGAFSAGNDKLPRKPCRLVCRPIQMEMHNPAALGLGYLSLLLPGPPTFSGSFFLSIQPKPGTPMATLQPGVKLGVLPQEAPWKTGHTRVFAISAPGDLFSDT
jgi:hypothetical protein